MVQHAIDQRSEIAARVHAFDIWRPRFICSREFRHLYLKAETRQAKTKEKLLAEGSVSATIAEQSQAEQYATRHEWGVPSDTTLKKHHPLNGQLLWRFVLQRVGVPVSDGTCMCGR